MHLLEAALREFSLGGGSIRESVGMILLHEPSILTARVGDRQARSIRQSRREIAIRRRKQFCSLIRTRLRDFSLHSWSGSLRIRELRSRDSRSHRSLRRLAIRRRWPEEELEQSSQPRSRRQILRFGEPQLSEAVDFDQQLHTAVGTCVGVERSARRLCARVEDAGPLHVGPARHTPALWTARGTHGQSWSEW